MQTKGRFRKRNFFLLAINKQFCLLKKNFKVCVDHDLGVVSTVLKQNNLMRFTQRKLFIGIKINFIQTFRVFYLKGFFNFLF